MRYYELTESNDTIIKAIKHNCQPWLQATNNPTGLYRGIRDTASVLNKKVRLTKRMTTAMPTHLHDGLNEWFSAKFGAPYRNAAFCTGDNVITLSFGSTYSIFPKGEFSFLWSPNVWDLNMRVNDAMATHDDTIPEGDTPEEEVHDLQTRVLPSMNYTNKDIDAAMKAKVEIMLRCESYYAVSTDVVNDEFKQALL